MSMSKREKVMSVATLFVIAFGVVGTQIGDRLKIISEKREELSSLDSDIFLQNELIAAKPRYSAKYDEIKHQIPVFEKGNEVNTYWQYIMDNEATKHNVHIGSRRPLGQTRESDVSEYAVEVRNWEATLSSFVKFMHAMQSQGAMLNIREMNIQPKPNAPGMLQGAFTLYCAYMEGDKQEAVKPAPAAVAEKTQPVETPPDTPVNVPVKIIESIEETKPVNTPADVPVKIIESTDEIIPVNTPADVPVKIIEPIEETEPVGTPDDTPDEPAAITPSPALSNRLSTAAALAATRTNRTTATSIRSRAPATPAAIFAPPDPDSNAPSP